MSYFCPTDPTSQEEGTYKRIDCVFFLDERPIPGQWDPVAGTFLWKWKHSQAWAQLGPVTALVDGQVASDPTMPVGTVYPVLIKGLTDGWHIVDFQGNYGHVLKQALLVNRTGAPLPDEMQTPSAPVRRFELSHAMSNDAVPLAWPGAMPTPKFHPHKPREFVSFNGERVPKAQRWTRRNFLQHSGGGCIRRWVRMPTGDIGIERESKYFYADAIDKKNGLRPAMMTLRDGPRGVAVSGFIFKMILRRGAKAIYMSDTLGRFSILNLKEFSAPPGSDFTHHKIHSEQYAMTTFAGWRVKEDELKVHGAVRSVAYMYSASSRQYRPEDQELYNSKWDHCGDWSQVVGPKTTHRPWGFAVARRIAPNTQCPLGIDDRDGLEFWWCDTLHHRILFLNGWTQHGAHYIQPHFPPVGYTAPDQPTGQTQLFKFIGSDDGVTPTEFCNEPWDCAVNPIDGKIYWTNFLGMSICRANLDGSNPEIVLKSSKMPELWEFGLAGSNWMERANKPIAEIRTNFLIDGPPGVATCCHPQGIGIDSEGNIVWGERHTKAVRKLDLKTMTVGTRGLIPDGGGLTDVALIVDREAAVGPRDDVFVQYWQNGDYRFDKDGNKIERPFLQSGYSAKNGPYNYTEGMNYAWGMCCGENRMYAHGNAGGHFFIEYSRRLPTDQALDYRRWDNGREALYYSNHPPGTLLHGKCGENELGVHPTVDDLGALDDATLRAYLRDKMHVSEGLIEDAVYYVRFATIDNDYSGEGEDMGQIADLLKENAELKAENAQLTEQVEAQAATIEAQGAEIAELESANQAAEDQLATADALAKQIDAAIPDAP